jgi:hypothetical protein
MFPYTPIYIGVDFFDTYTQVYFWNSKKKYHYFANICWVKSSQYQPSEYSWHGLGSLKKAIIKEHQHEVYSLPN